MLLIDAATEGFNAGVTLIGGLITAAQQVVGHLNGVGVVALVLMVVVGVFMAEHTGPAPKGNSKVTREQSVDAAPKAVRKGAAQRRRHAHEMASSMMMANRRW